MSVNCYTKGHLVFWRNTAQGEGWYYEDFVKVDPDNLRPCTRCGKTTTTGHDACIENLPGVKFACCGHGKEEGYIKFEDGRIIRGNFYVEE